MALKLTLKPDERVIINGCVIRNSGRRQTLTIENRADVVREDELLNPEDAVSPVKRAYFLLQTALISPDQREGLRREIQRALADLVPVFRAELTLKIFESASNLAIGDYYKAMRALRPVVRHEETLLAHLAGGSGSLPDGALAG